MVGEFCALVSIQSGGILGYQNHLAPLNGWRMSKRLEPVSPWVSFQNVILLLRKPSWPLFQNKSCLNSTRQDISIEIKLLERGNQFGKSAELKFISAGLWLTRVAFYKSKGCITGRPSLILLEGESHSALDGG